MNPIQLPSLTVSTDPAIMETATLRQARAEVNQLQEILNSYPSFHDSLTETLRSQVTFYLDQLKSYPEHSKDVIDQQRTLFVNLLIDPVLQKPLDEECLLGSDGHTYSHKSLSVLLALRTHLATQLPEIIQQWQPVTVSNHPVASAFVKWLRQLDLAKADKWIEQTYEMLDAQCLLAPIPTKMNPYNIIDESESLYANLKIEDDWNNSTLLNECQELLDANRVNMVGAELERKAFSEQSREIHTQQLREIHEVGQTIAVDEEAYGKVLAKFEQEIDELNKNIEENYNRLQYLQTSINQTEAGLIRLQIAYKEAERRIKERNKGWFGSIMGTLGGIAACVFTTIILGPAGGSVAPSVDGGAIINFKIAF